MPTREDEPWQSRAICGSLSPTEADNLFFVGPGKKSNKAKAFCSRCPVQGSCLMDALDNELEGFFSGTTEKDRRQMAALYDKALSVLDTPEVHRKATQARYLHVIKAPDNHDWLDEVEPTDEELYQLEA